MESANNKLGIYSQNSKLVEDLSNKFIDKGVEVKVFQDFNKINLSNLSYLIINLLVGINDIDINLIKSNIKNINCKTIVLFPLSVKNKEKYVSERLLSDLLELNSQLGVLLIPEVLGEGVKFNNSYISHNLINQTLLSEKIKLLDENYLINLISLRTVVDKIIRETFSFGIAGQKLALVGYKKGARIFCTKYLRINSNNLIRKTGDYGMSEISYDSLLKSDFSLDLAIKQSKKYIADNYKFDRHTPKNNNFILNNVLKFLVSIIILPIIAFVASLVMLIAGVKLTLININLSEQLVNYSANLIKVPKYFNFGNTYLYNSSNLVLEMDEIVKEGFLIIKYTKNLVSMMMGGYSNDNYPEKLSASLDKVYIDLGYFQNNLVSLGFFSKSFDLNQIRTKIYLLKTLSSRLTNLIGLDTPKKYLVLFQNNMELRPTGGFIGSFAIITFDKGRVTEITVNDVYSADGQLKGHIEPPQAIKNYLGEANWFLRDSNWDPDFNVSARKAEWFLEKELGLKVDGVVSIDLFFVNKLLEVTGAINLTDFDKVIDSNNLYQVTQNEVEKDFFPGSIKKASFLTSLSKTLFNELQSLPSSKYLKLLYTFYSNLEYKHIQVYLHDDNANNAIIKLGYSGVLNMLSDCGQRCVDDKYMLIDANLGVNKSNFYINRKQEVNVSLYKTNINHELLINYSNSAPVALGSMGVYKSYTRLMLPVNTKIYGLRLYDSAGNFEELPYDTQMLDNRKEIGFYFEVLPKSSKNIQIVWELENSNLANGGEYRLSIIKQSGTEGDVLNVKTISKELTLTGRQVGVYNTDLLKDFTTTLFYK